MKPAEPAEPACVHSPNRNTAHEGPGPHPPPSPLISAALALSAQGYREMRHRDLQRAREGWYLALPWWVVHHGGLTFEEFAAKFDESAKRTHIYLMGVVGFETVSQWNDEHVRRHRISWLDDGTQSPRQEESAND